MKLRELLNAKPWIAWTIALIAVGVAVLFYLRNSSGNEIDSVKSLSEMVTVRCTETGQEWEMNRGRLVQMLMQQSGPINVNQGIPSQFAEGRLTGVIVDKNAWEATVNYVNGMKKGISSRSKAGG